MRVISDPYSAMKAASCMPHHCFCEAIRFGDWIRQPSNSWSNLAFTCVAMFILWFFFREKAERSNRLVQYPVYTWLFAFGTFLIGFGSFYYHASLTFMGQWFDVMGMYFTVTFFILYNIDRLLDVKPVKFMLYYFALNVMLALVLAYVPEARRYLFGGFVAAFLLSVWYVQARMKSHITSTYLFLALGCLGIGFGLWVLDIQKIVCVPYSVWQLHAAWHVLTALSSCFIYMYYFSEDDRC